MGLSLNSEQSAILNYTFSFFFRKQPARAVLQYSSSESILKISEKYL